MANVPGLSHTKDTVEFDHYLHVESMLKQVLALIARNENEGRRTTQSEVFAGPLGADLMKFLFTPNVAPLTK
jgi:hypothetical protein